MTAKQELPEEKSQPDPSAEQAPVIDADQLFRGSREVWLEHAGVRYRLRITRRNKLILQK